MVEDIYIHNKFKLNTRGNSIIFDTGYIDSNGIVLSTRSVILDDVFKMHILNNVHTRSIRMFLILLAYFVDPIRRGKSANRFYDYMYFLC